MSDIDVEAELIADLERDILRYEKRASEHEADALKCRRGAAGCRGAIEYIIKKRALVSDGAAITAPTERKE